MASCLSDYITDEILQSLSRSQQTLAGHLSRRGQQLLHHDSQETEVIDEREIQMDNVTQQPEQQPQRTQKVKRKSIHSRMFRPMSAAFELGFDLCKALEDVCVDDLLPPPLSPTPPPPLPVTPPPVEAELQQSRPMSFSDLPTEDTPTLQHVTKYRPRRTKKTKPRRAANQPISRAAAQEVEVDHLDEGVPEFFSRKVTNVSVRPRESRLSGFFCSIKHRPSAKATPTSPTATAESEAPPPAPAVTPDPVAAPEVKGQAQEGIKRGSPHKGVQMLGNDMLAEIRAKQDKRKKAGVSPAAAARAEAPDEGRDHEHTTPAAQKNTRDEPAANKLKHTPQHTPEHTPTSDSCHPSVPPSSSGCITPPPLACVPESPALPAPPLCPWVLLSVTEGAEPGPVTHSTEGGDSPPPLESPAGASVFDTHTSHTLTVSRSISCVHSSTEPEDDATDRQRSKSLPSAAPTNHVS